VRDEPPQPPSRLPAQIAEQIEYAVLDVDKVRDELGKMMAAETADQALLHYNEIRLRLRFAQEAQRKALTFFGTAKAVGLAAAKPAPMVVTRSTQAVKEWVERRLTPAELRSLHRVADYTVDPDPEEQLDLGVVGQ